MEFTDTHCHIQSAGLGGDDNSTSGLWSSWPDLTADKVIQNAYEAQVSKMICVGCDLADSKLAIDFVKHQPNCYASIGIHPHEAQSNLLLKSLDQFKNLLEKLLEARPVAAKIVAIGECGLDYFYDYSPKSAQVEILKFQIELALTYNLPMIFHVREAFDDFWPILESYPKIRGVLHSFTDSRANLERALGHDLFIGVNGIATFTKDSRQLAMYKSIPLQKLLLETDAPYLTPAPHRGTINQPKFVRRVAEFLSELMSEGLDDLAMATSRNAAELFNLGV
ncbi:MAG: TatD family hydrolase [Candidatus Saccharimonadales bacterium]